MSLTEQLQNVITSFQTKAPKPVVDTIVQVNDEFEKTFDFSKAIKVGDKLPAFELPNATSETVRSADLLSNGPLLITFYRGEWCPFCNLALAALQKRHADFEAKGVTVVAISPELPDQTLTTQEKNELKFPVLSDVGNKFARELGIIFPMPDSLRPVFKGFGNDLVKRNGDDSFELPVPATLLVDTDGTVKNVFLETNYMKRVEPQTALDWVDALQK